MNEHLKDHAMKEIPPTVIHPSRYKGAFDPLEQSDLVPDGFYELETRAARNDKSADNHVFVDEIVGPANGDWIGKRLVTFHPAPVGDPESKQVIDGTQFIMHRIGAQKAYESDEQYKAFLENPKPELKYAAKTFVGKRFYVYVTRGDKTEKGDYSNRSQIKNYLSSKRIYAAGPPGPRKAATGAPANGANGSRETPGRQSALDAMAGAPPATQRGGAQAVVPSADDILV